MSRTQNGNNTIMSQQTMFKLYVAGDAPNSQRAIANLAALCREYFPGQNVVEIVDVFKHPNYALAEGIYMTPTLVKLSPAPERKIVGTLSDKTTLLLALGLGHD